MSLAPIFLEQRSPKLCQRYRLFNLGIGKRVYTNVRVTSRKVGQSLKKIQPTLSS